MQQGLEALEEVGVESGKVQKYLPDFLKQLLEDLEKELRGEQEHDHNLPANLAPPPVTTSSQRSLCVSDSKSDVDILSIRS